MILLPNGCRCDGFIDREGNKLLPVFPSNWNTTRAPMQRHWYIHYRFVDLATSKAKLVIIKGMNSYKLLAGRQEATAELIANEIYLLISKGYNPITGQFMVNPET